MRRKTLPFIPSRRAFLTNALPASTLFCLGCGGLFAQEKAQAQPKPAQPKHKFLEDSGMSFQKVFEFAYEDFIELMQFLAGQVGKEKLLDMLKRGSDEYAQKEAQKYLKKLPKNDFATFKAQYKEKPNRFWEHVLTSVITEDTDRSIAKKITECLYAKIFRDAGAADIGYAYECYYDFPAAQAFNLKLKLIRTKTLMAGDDCCNPRYVWEG
jgi:hypothetical protein